MANKSKKELCDLIKLLYFEDDKGDKDMRLTTVLDTVPKSYLQTTRDFQVSILAYSNGFWTSKLICSKVFLSNLELEGMITSTDKSRGKTLDLPLMVTNSTQHRPS